LRFCHVTTFYPPYHYGGDAIITQAICEQLANLGHEVDVVYCRDAFELNGFETDESRPEVARLTVHEIRHPLGPLSPIITHQTGRPGLKRPALKGLLDREYDVVHFHNISLIGGPAVLKMSRAPVTLYSAHEHWLFCPTHVLWKNRNRPCDKPTCFTCTLLSGKPPQLWRYTKLLPDALKHVDCLLSPSRFTAQKHIDAGIRTPIRFFPFFSPVQPDGSQRTVPSGEPVFVYTGRLERSKGIESLLDVFARRPDYRLLVAGSGSLEDKLRQRFVGHRNIRILGLCPHARIRALLNEAVALILPSWGPEVSPLSVLEALSCGVPAIIRRAGGSAEMVEASGGGWVYDRPEELPMLLDHIVANPELVVETGLKALRYAEKNLGIENWMDRYFNLIQQIKREKSP